MSGIKDLAAKGRNGDNTLMHVSTEEVAGLNALARETMGRDLTTNPETGLPEAFLFAPLAAPLIAGSGAGALGIGLTAGALGAAEAELRDMDDPLRRGLFAGLTAGAASGIGNALSSAAPEAATVGSAGGPDLSQAVQTPGASAGNMQSVPQASFPGTNFTPPPTPAEATSSLGLSPSAPSALTPATVQSTAPSPGIGQQIGQRFTESQYSEAPQMLEGAKNIFRDEAARAQFMQDVRAPAMAGFVGLGGQAQMRAQDEMKDRQEAADRESAAELKEAQDRIRANYAAIGRPMPTGFGGSPLFASGGIVNLRRGGNVGGPGGGSDPGNRGGGRSSSSRGGGGGGRSTHPGRPGGESGERSMTRGGGGRDGGSTAAVQQPRQLDPDKIRAAVISPMDDLATGIGRLVSMSPTVRALQHLTRDRRGLGGAAPYGPGAPLTARERGVEPASARRDGGGGDGSAPIIPRPAPAAEPTLPLMATPTPTPNEQEFLAQLRQGAGNRAAMRNTGYTGAPTQGFMGGGIIRQAAEAAKKIQGTPTAGPTTSEKDPDFQRFLAELQKGAGNRQAMQDTGYTGMASGGYLDGGMLPGDGMSDDVPATIDGDQPAALSSGEFVIPADVVSHIGNGSSDAGAKELYAMMDRIREARTGTDEQAPEVNTRKMLPK